MTEKQLLKRIGARIKEVRQKKGLSQLQLAAMFDSEKSAISRLESGKLNIKVATLYKVAKGLDISLSELLKIQEDK